MSTYAQNLLPVREFDGTGLHIGIIVARYNSTITTALLELTTHELARLGVHKADTHVADVPGSFELAIAAQAMLTNPYDAIICIGCIMKGETRHDVIVGDAAAQGIQQIALATHTPIIFGVICAENQQQATARIERGREFAQTAVELAHTVQLLRQTK